MKIKRIILIATLSLGVFTGSEVINIQASTWHKNTTPKHLEGSWISKTKHRRIYVVTINSQNVVSNLNKHFILNKPVKYKFKTHTYTIVGHYPHSKKEAVINIRAFSKHHVKVTSLGDKNHPNKVNIDMYRRL